MPKILAIDDKRDNLTSISALLTTLIPDCVILTADSGKEGIEKAKNELPDTILLDIIMPEMDGFEVCGVLKSNDKTKHIPIIMLTAIRTDSKSRVKALEIGADAFLSKPIDEAELVAQVKVMLRIKRAEDLLRQERDSLEMQVRERMNELERLQAQLQQAQKMESIGTLAGGIAHDFNNILTPIMIHSEMVMAELPPESPFRNNLRQIFESGERARDLVKQILTFSRQRQQEREALRIGLIVKDIIKLLRASLPTTIEIRQNINTQSDTVFADLTQIHQVLINLCTNAAHAMREKGGILEIDLTNETLDSKDLKQFPDLSPGSYLKTVVKDTGHGMDNKIMNRIFDPYFTTKGLGEGTGMGLAVVHGIVKSHGGEITVESTPGIGTVFHILFPTIEAKVSPVIKRKVIFPKGNEKILLVDDEKASVDVIQTMLEKLGYEVTARTSSTEALEAYRNSSQTFDLVITDQTMPNMTGKELAQKLLAIDSDIPIILCTGFSEQIDGDKAKEMGIRSYVMKPIVMGDMAMTVRQVLDEKRSQDVIRQGG